MRFVLIWQNRKKALKRRAMHFGADLAEQEKSIEAEGHAFWY